MLQIKQLNELSEYLQPVCHRWLKRQTLPDLLYNTWQSSMRHETVSVVFFWCTVDCSSLWYNQYFIFVFTWWKKYSAIPVFILCVCTLIWLTRMLLKKNGWCGYFSTKDDTSKWELCVGQLLWFHMWVRDRVEG